MKTCMSIAILFVMTGAVTHGQSSRSDATIHTAIHELTKVAHEHGLTPLDCEPVMVEGMSLTFTNANGTMTITCGKGFERHYTWAGDTRTVVMIPRKERWYGSLGMYNPGSYISGEVEPWKEHDGIKRYVVEEGQRHFTNTTDAVNWIQRRGRSLSYIYNDSGLVVGMQKSLPPPEMVKQGAPGTLSVDVWQVYINGKKPKKLEGAQNDAITVHYPASYDMHTVEPPRDPVDHDYCPFDASRFFNHKR